jgi:hypothetical protein
VNLPLKKIGTLTAALALMAMQGCATAPAEPTEPAKVVSAADLVWQRNRESHYRSLGWSTLDARYQAEQDLERGKTSPVEHRHLTRGTPPPN